MAFTSQVPSPAGREGARSSDETRYPMRLQLINPSNPLVSANRVKENRWNRYRVWKPLGLMALAGLTSPGWEIAIADENLGVPDYAALPRPDVGITAFTSQANRAYEVAAHFRHLGVPVSDGRHPRDHVRRRSHGACGLGGHGRGRGRLAAGPGRRSAWLAEAPV